MSSLSAKDRVSLCSFTFSDGRRCRTPRNRNHPHFCFYHAQKEARATAAQKLGKDLAYFFSGDYLSGCDLSTALGRLIPAVLRGDVKPRAARTVAYLAQTLLQAIRISQHEYCEAFDTNDWRKSIRNSVKGNHDYRFPPVPQPAPSAFRETLRNAPSALRTNLRSERPPSPQPPPAQTPVNCHSERSEESAFSYSPAQPPTHAPQSEIPTLSAPASSPHAPLPSTRAEFAQQLLTGRNLSRSGREAGGGQAPQPAQTPPSQPVETPVNCHPERNEGSASSSSSPLVTRPSPLPQVQQPAPAPLQIEAQRNYPTPPAKTPQPTSVAPSFRSGALPPHVRRRLHRAPA